MIIKSQFDYEYLERFSEIIHFTFHKNLNPHEYFIAVELKVDYFSNKLKGSFIFYFYHEHEFFYSYFYKLGDIDLCSED